MSSNNLDIKGIKGGPRAELGYDNFSLPDSVDQVGGRLYQKYGFEVGLDIFERFHLYAVPGLTIGAQKNVQFSSSSLDFAQGGTCPDDQRDPFTDECFGNTTTRDTSSTVVSSHGGHFPLMAGMDLISGRRGALAFDVGYAHGWGNMNGGLFPASDNLDGHPYQLETLTHYKTDDGVVEMSGSIKTKFFDAALAVRGALGSQQTTSLKDNGSDHFQTGLHCQTMGGLKILFHTPRENKVLPPGYQEANQKAQALVKDFKSKYVAELQEAGIIDVRVVPYSFPKDREGKSLPSLGMEGWYYNLELTRRNEAGTTTGPASSVDHYISLEELAQALSNGT